LDSAPVRAAALRRASACSASLSCFLDRAPVRAAALLVAALIVDESAAGARHGYREHPYL